MHEENIIIIIIIITCFIRCWQNAAKYNHEVGLIYIKVDKTIHTNEIKCNLDEECNAVHKLKLTNVNMNLNTAFAE